MSNYLPFGFVYPEGFSATDAEIEAVKHRMEYLNGLFQYSPVGEEHKFAAALALLQKTSNAEVGLFWDTMASAFNEDEVAAMALALFPLVENERPRLNFPNATALFDCRFVSTKEWEHIRRYSIGGSEASTVLGLSHFQTQRSLYHEKRTPYADDKDVGFQHILDYGHAVEDHVIGYWASHLGAIVWPEYRMFAHKEYPFITCNPDGILVFRNGKLSLFEAKTAIWVKMAEWREGIPSYYAPQPKQYMEVLNDPRLQDGYIGVCFGGLEKDMMVHHYVRNPAEGKAQIEAVVNFWRTYIVPEILPPFSGESELDCTALYKYAATAYSPSTACTLPTSCEALFEQYSQLDKERKALAKEAKALKAEEEELRNQIADGLPEGLTIVQIPQNIAYRIKISDANRETVNSTELAKHPVEQKFMSEIAQTLKENNPDWVAPQITIKIETKK